MISFCEGQAYVGRNVLVAIALGDSLGLPFENLKRPHVKRLQAKTGVRHITLSDGKALISDDTEHALFTIRAMVEAGDDPSLFEKALGRQLARWCSAMPPGIGRATLRSSVKIICGMSPRKSGVRSAGNGPLMRVPVIAVRYRDDRETMKEFIKISTSMTHTDPRALAIAQFVGDLMLAAEEDVLSWETVRSCLDRALGEGDFPDKYMNEMRSMMEAISKFPPEEAGPEDAMAAMGCGTGVSGYILHTAIAAAWCAVKAQGDVSEAIRLSVEAGGDTDSLAAVAAALTAVSPGAVQPDTSDIHLAGSWAGEGRIQSYGMGLDRGMCSLEDLPEELSIVQQLQDNMNALSAMVRHIFWRRMF